MQGQAVSLKTKIMDAATRLFAQKGFRYTAISEIAKAAGAAEGTIFHHFKSKEGLFLEVLKRAQGRIIHNVDENVHGREFSSGLEMVEEVVKVYFYMTEGLRSELALLYRSHSYELAVENSACRKSLESIYNCFLTALVEGIVLGQKDGSISKDILPTKTALIILAMLNGLIRFDLAHIFPVDSLYNDVLKTCRRILKNYNVGEESSPALAGQ
ncbi:TetR/AcrR family transcriptional regulator [Desulfohalobiaceae bacterium Ax17]|jgi:AcrR family transcriptional regulator|uniref:TetR/AcrR family transcriptional regulator n=1 Tax=Desulfovulcanus ferrireducens TaxID=2831190 RepID=UPI0025A4B42F|nr:TetR/AcrR family transcriptional regulator [Desulfovulcanus ferrireducens]MBT8762779.1 TetR/AcrR family transcriptional regulator [Desulfovulcanus ferrireducens]